jgi:hypothetical protein
MGGNCAGLVGRLFVEIRKRGVSVSRILELLM